MQSKGVMRRIRNYKSGIRGSDCGLRIVDCGMKTETTPLVILEESFLRTERKRQLQTAAIFLHKLHYVKLARAGEHHNFFCKLSSLISFPFPKINPYLAIAKDRFRAVLGGGYFY